MVAPKILRQRRVRIIALTALTLLVALAYDWARPPREQISVAFYVNAVMGAYRICLKPVADRFVRCRFEPTCSHYSEEAMLAHGFPKGVWLTVSRLVHCTPSVAPGTRDPVPLPTREIASVPESP